MFCQFRARQLGSPPRARGEVVYTDPETFKTRITPACAGRSHREEPPTRGCRDHPRVRGEKAARWLFPPCQIGSPPRARGEAIRKNRRNGRTGITPACAGRSALKSAQPAFCGDHPRVRGEKSSIDHENLSRAGSPPRARGEGHQIRKPRVSGGITPACAGRRSRWCK